MFLEDTTKIEVIAITQADTSFYYNVDKLNRVKLDLFLLSQKNSLIRVETSDSRDDYFLRLDSSQLSGKKSIKFINRMR